MVVEELNFSFITTSLAAFAKPTLKSHFQFLREQNISTIISLTENPIDAFDFQFEQFHIPITDFTPPTIGQINEAVKIIESARSQKKITGIHCAKGRGRAGTIAASYLVYLQHLSADESIEKIRKLRPGSIETIEQEVIIKTYQISLDEPKSISTLLYGSILPLPGRWWNSEPQLCGHARNLSGPACPGIPSTEPNGVELSAAEPPGAESEDEEFRNSNTVQQQDFLSTGASSFTPSADQIGFAQESEGEL